MRNTYQKLPFHRRHWFLGLLIALTVVACVGAVVAYTLHLQFLDKAASFDMSELGKMESASTIFDRQHVTFGYIYEQKREPVPIAQMPLVLQHAVVSAEDNRFYTHSGSDFRGMLRAALKNLRSSRIRQGASTITQQLARNTFPLKGRTFGRKILEIYVARRIETTLTKDQIMEYYLNRIYLGSGLYGVEAASKGYFGKPARDLTLGESATLAGLIKSPNNLSPWHDKHAAQGQRDFVLGRMVDEGYISREESQTAVGEELAVKPRVLASSDSYAMEAIRQQVIAQVGLDRAISEGLKIYTTIDARLQKVAEDSLHKQLDEIERNPAFQNHQTYAQYTAKFSDAEKQAAAAVTDPTATPVNVHATVGAPEYLQGSFIALNNADGAVLALVGGRDFHQSEFNRAMHPQARRPAGTAFTPFVYAAAYQKGIFPGRLFLDQVMDNRQVMVGGQTGILGEWGVERSGNHYDGSHPGGPGAHRGQKRGDGPRRQRGRAGQGAGTRQARGHHLADARFPRDFPRQQRNHPLRTRARVHRFSQRRLATRRALSAHQDRGRRRAGALSDQNPSARAHRGRGPGVPGAFRAEPGIEIRRGGGGEYPPETPPQRLRRKTRHVLQLHRRAVRRVR